MTISSQWRINALESIPSLEDGLVNVISIIHCEKTAVSEDGFNARWYGMVSVKAPHPALFIPYEEVTEEVVISWVEDSLTTANVDANLEQQIEGLRNPSIQTLALPWAAPIPAVSEVQLPIEPAEPEVQL